nr:tyrosine-type recombinase/integrase [Paenibacillus alvei]
MEFATFVEEWRSKYAVKHLEHKTLYSYESNLKNRILPYFRHLKLDEIKPLHIVDFLDKLEKDGSRRDRKSGKLASATIGIQYRILKNIFNRAVDWRIIKRNPVTDVQKPKALPYEVMPYDEAEVAQMFCALQKEPYHWRVMITLALTTGLRRSELLGLEWKHIDWEKGIIDVSQTMVHALKGHVIVKKPKTKNSTRKVALPNTMLQELKVYYDYRLKERSDIGSAWYGGEWFFVFSHPNGQPFHHERPYLWFRQFIKKMGLDISGFMT